MVDSTSESQTFSSAPASGMRDLLSAETALRDWATAVILRTYQRFGFTRIETPIMEHINLLRRGDGGENLQLIFEVLKRGDKLDRALNSGEIKREALADFGLRFDLTVPLARFYANNQSALPIPFKSIQIGPVFRAERSQKGRYRQFTQCDIDIVGIKSEFAEMELVQATATALVELGFKGFTIRLNDRRILTDLAQACEFSADCVETVFITLDKLDKIGIEGVRRELHAASQSSEAVDRLIAILQAIDGEANFEKIRHALPTAVSPEVCDAINNVVTTCNQLSGGAFSVKFDATLVRGMGYYTGQIFEISHPGSAHSIAGGGRYDGMIGKFSGQDTPACGFSIGFERIIGILSEQGFKPPSETRKIALTFDPKRDQMSDVAQAAVKLREDGSTVSLLPRKKDTRKQLDALAAEGYNHFCNFRSDNLQVIPLSVKS